MGSSVEGVLGLVEREGFCVVHGRLLVVRVRVRVRLRVRVRVWV